MSPIYLMGEGTFSLSSLITNRIITNIKILMSALVPGRKVGTTFIKGGKELYTVAEEITKELAISK
jgi:hypothetical protein